MINTIIWNVRRIKIQGVLKRIKILKKMYQLSIVSLLEPFSDSDHLLNFMVQLNMENVENNFNGKIWLFWSSDIDYTNLYNDQKHINFSIKQMKFKLN